MAGSPAPLSDAPLSNLEAVRDGFYERLQPEHLSPLWKVLARLVTTTPLTQAVPAAWSFARVRELLMEAGGLITAAEAERRVLILENPALPGQSRITQTLYAGLQLILPGEVAPAHRHTQNALRFIMDGEGAFTALDGERAYMHKYDLVLTPAMLWHDHGNETDDPMIWLDGLDIPLVQILDASFAEHREDRGAVPTTRPAGDSLHRWGRNLRPARSGRVAGQANPLFIYPFAEWRESLEVLRRSEAPHPHDAYLMEFTNPTDGGPVMATISAFARLVPAAFRTRPMRSTDAMIHVVVEGEGSLLIDGQHFPLHPGEIVVTPSWSERILVAEQDLILFSFSDKATQEKLSLWREKLG
ncbi:gentisate 1,2-dioxygenase [Sphingobium sp. LB126]|jgi:gentisate 1,2-dioxygenase|uniref:gentisate 1,2-dioxygenase n=1 Tax=Sphingobium TaxID=165695 RepID=UPI000C20F6AE|nr:gentisate 1,2-dioxygenase [Sphingobium sp. LB126]PJG45564.1 gentisate 1,2-dioxygenase [Sphingobium sp. LB126]